MSDLIDQLARQGEFGGMGQFHRLLGIDQQQRVVVFAKGGRADVAHQQRHAFALAFGLRVSQ